MTDIKEQERNATLLQTARAVIWSFLGIRSKNGFETDLSRLSLPKVIAVGIAGAVMFVVSLLLLVNLILR